jgi:hypothetical protein
LSGVCVFFPFHTFSFIYFPNFFVFNEHDFRIWSDGKRLSKRDQKISIYDVSITRWFKYDRDYLCVNKSQFVPVIFEPPCIISPKKRVDLWNALYFDALHNQTCNWSTAFRFLPQVTRIGKSLRKRCFRWAFVRGLVGVSAFPDLLHLRTDAETTSETACFKCALDDKKITAEWQIASSKKYRAGLQNSSYTVLFMLEPNPG